VHGVGGFVGAILTGVFAHSSLGGVGLAEGVSIADQVLKQLMGAGVTIVYCSVVSFVLLKLIDAVIGLRATPEQEQEGLDLALHDERGYNLT
jgi:Amt family ammonium transporter